VTEYQGGGGAGGRTQTITSTIVRTSTEGGRTSGYTTTVTTSASCHYSSRSRPSGITATPLAGQPGANHGPRPLALRCEINWRSELLMTCLQTSERWCTTSPSEPSSRSTP